MAKEQDTLGDGRPSRRRDAGHRARYFTPQMEAAGYYPIFINWESALTQTYLEHLLHVRQGNYKNDWYALPFVLVEDLFHYAGRALGVWRSMFSSDLEGLPFPASRLMNEADSIYCHYRRLDESGASSTPQISQGPNDLRLGEKLGSLARYMVTLPTKIALAPIIDAAGSESWEIMLRHVELLFRKDTTCTSPCLDEQRSSATPDVRAAGDLKRFLDRFQEVIDHDAPSKWHITLIGHSAGAIVGNRILRTSQLHFDHVVYMAAACTVQDYEESVPQYMQRPKNADTEVYNLMLHEAADLRDRFDDFPRIVDLPPRGSLRHDPFLGSATACTAPSGPPVPSPAS